MRRNRYNMRSETQSNAIMEIRTLLSTLAVVASLIGASHSAGKIENIESYRPVEPRISFWDVESSSIDKVTGYDIAPNSHPHQAILFLKVENQEGEQQNGLCGGSLLSDSWVVTAAQCVDKRVVFRNEAANSDEYKLTVTVGVGAHDLVDIQYGNATNVQLVNAEKIIVHPKWSLSALVNDIALLKLEKSVALDGKYTKSIRLPKLSQKEELFHHSSITVSGWGLTSSKSWSSPKLLRATDSKVIDSFYCKIKYFFLLVKETHICTSNSREPLTSQAGDIGGPMIIKESDNEPTLIGITSFGFGWQWGYPNLFTRVTSFLDWIHETTNIAPRN